MRHVPAPDPQRTLRIITANVLIKNRDAASLLAICREQDPDIILLAEPDDWWIEQCRALEKSHRFTIIQPQSNTYGLAIYEGDQSLRWLDDFFVLRSGAFFWKTPGETRWGAASRFLQR